MPAAVHGFVEVANRQRADVAGYGADVVGRLAVQGNGGQTRLILRAAEVPTDIIRSLRRIIGYGKASPPADDQLAW